MKSIQQAIRDSLSGLAMFIIILVIVLTNLGISLVFTSYLSSVKEKENDFFYSNTVEALQDGTIQSSEASEIRQIANRSGIHIVVSSIDGKEIFDSMITGSGTKRALLSKRNIPLTDAEIAYKSYRINPESGGQYILKIGREKGWLISDPDLYFIIGINIIFICTLIISITIVRIMSKSISVKISKPIIELKESTENIKKGNYTNVELVNADTKELHNLAESIKELAHQLYRQENLRKQLTTDISHELRSPLAVIRSQIEAIRDGVLEPSDERLGRLNVEILRVTRLIDDMNELSVVENNLNEIKKSSVDLSELVTNIGEDYEVIFESKELILEIEVEQALMVSGDEARLKQVMNNLLANALKYTEKGVVKVSLSRIASDAVLVVQDTGIGISEDSLPLIFERFYRAEPSRNRNTGGAGIGLAIVKKLIDAYDGRIEVESKIGVGSRFTVFLPLI